MSKCQISIELSGPEDFARPGGELEVIVHVSCNSVVKCNGLSLTRSWRTHGLGNPDQGGKEAEKLFSGTWEAGEYAYPTTVRFPETPTSYHGEAINVDWYLEAQANLPQAINRNVEQMVLVTDPDAPEPYTPPNVWAPQPVKLSAGIGSGMMLALVLIPVVFILMLVFTPKLGGLLVPLVLYLAFSFHKRRAATQAVGQVSLELYPRATVPGGEVHVMLEIKPERSIAIEHVTVQLLATESTTSGSGTTATSRRDQAFLLEERVASGVQLSGTNHLEEEVTFHLPVKAPTSFEAEHNEITTKVRVEIQPVGQALVSFDQNVRVGTLRGSDSAST